MKEEQNKLVEEIVVKIYEKYPDLVEKFGDHGKKRPLRTTFTILTL